jgi:hypothetical protein
MLQLEECFNEFNNHQQQQCHEHQNFEGTRRPQRPHLNNLNNSHLKPLASHIHIHSASQTFTTLKTLDLSKLQTLDRTLNAYVMILTTTAQE